jgi:hypothetical protein
MIVWILGDTVAKCLVDSKRDSRSWWRLTCEGLSFPVNSDITLKNNSVLTLLFHIKSCQVCDQLDIPFGDLSLALELAQLGQLLQGILKVLQRHYMMSHKN